MRAYLLSIFSLSFFLFSCTSKSDKTNKAEASLTPPNIIILLADDVSWNDFGCYGNADVQTPNIDKIAANGIRFNNFYLTASSCSPSRNSIITGRYPHNTGAAELHTQPPLEMISFPEVLRKSGYYNVLAGKSHMGAYIQRGFDHIYDKRSENGDGGEDMWLESIKDRPKNKPFFMWFAAYDAHRAWGENQFSGTHQGEQLKVPSYLANSTDTKADLAKYYDEIKRFDHYIGQVMDELRAQQVLENTLIIVMADNGRPFPHSKTRVNDRGMKTPFVVQWPKSIKKKNAICSSLVSAVDIAPTLLEIAGLTASDNFQGYSFSKLLKQPKKAFRNHIFAEHNWHDYEAHERMVRTKDYMFILNSRPMAPQSGPLDAINSDSYQDLMDLRDRGDLSAIQADVFVTPRPKEELYHYPTDPDQLLNLASVSAHASSLNQLRKALQTWMKDTGDDIPQELTVDWYSRIPGAPNTDAHGERGNMPGSSSEATKNNNKGKF